MSFERRKDHLELSLRFPEVFDPKMRERLSNGFTTRILAEIQLVDTKEDEPVSSTKVIYTILYDLWEERFQVRHEGPIGRQDYLLKSMKEVLPLCGAIQNLVLPLPKRYEAESTFRIKVRIIVNPTSLEQRKKVRDYLANPDGSSRMNSTRSFFGSFARIFVSEKDIQADVIYAYYSPLFRLSNEP